MTAAKPWGLRHGVNLSRDVDGDTWLTPRWILDHLGGFDLDPCAFIGNPGWTGAAKYFTKADDGLAQEWSGRVFLNPPYSDLVPWMLRMCDHGHGTALIPAAIEGIVWRDRIWKACSAVLFLHGRTRFANPDGSTTTGRPLRSAALVSFGEEDKRILEAAPFAGVYIDRWSSR